MNAAQPYLAALIFCALVGLALYYGRQQFHTFARLRSGEEISPEERGYLHGQAWRRLVNSGLMLLLAALIAGYYLTGLENRVTELGETVQAHNQQGAKLDLNPEQRSTRALFAGFCLSILLLLMAMVFLVAIDVWAIRRYSRQFMKQLNAERRAMLEGQVARLRAERNGHA